MIKIEITVEDGKVEAHAHSARGEQKQDCDIVHAIMKALMKLGQKEGTNGRLATNYKP